MKKLHYITSWDLWEELCAGWVINPYKNIEFGRDLGGGDSISFEYIGDVPKKDE